MHQENVELYKKLDLIGKENVELQRKVFSIRCLIFLYLSLYSSLLFFLFFLRAKRKTIINVAIDIWKWRFLLWQRLNRSFHSQAYGARDVNEKNESSQPPFTISNGYNLHAPIHLQLSQPENQTEPHPQNDVPAKAIKLGYVSPKYWLFEF